jgi:hypothetical protein
MEQNGSDLEDSDYEDEAEDDFLKADDEELPGGAHIGTMIMPLYMSSTFWLACPAFLLACAFSHHLGSNDMPISKKLNILSVKESSIVLQAARAQRMLILTMPWVSGMMQRRNCISPGSANGKRGSTS